MNRLSSMVLVVFVILSLGPMLATRAQDDLAFYSPTAYKRRELKRVAKELEHESDELVDDTKKFLKREHRWKPVGVDLRLWDEIRIFEDDLDQFKKHFNHVDDHHALKPEASIILRRGFRIDQLIYRVRPDHEVTEDWRRIHLRLQQLGQAYALGGRRDGGYAGVDRKEIKRAIAEIEDASDEIRDDLRKFLHRYDSYRHDYALWQLRAELDVFENAADDVKNHFNKVKDPRAVEPEVRVLLGQGRRIDHLMRRAQVSSQVRRDWIKIRANMDLLADAYEAWAFQWR